MPHASWWPSNSSKHNSPRWLAVFHRAMFAAERDRAAHWEDSQFRVPALNGMAFGQPLVNGKFSMKALIDERPILGTATG